MSLTSPRLIFPITALALAALMVASCGQQDLPTSPSRMTALTGQPSGLRPVVAEYFVDLVDDTPPPTGTERFRLLDDDPGPPPPPPEPGSKWSPWPPEASSRQPPGRPVPTPASTHERIRIKLDPGDEIRHSGKPVGIYSCRDNRHTWYYDQHVVADTGVPIKVSARLNYFDGRFVSENGNSFEVPGNSSVVLHTRWCSAVPRPHWAVTVFKGADANNKDFVFNGPPVALLSP